MEDSWNALDISNVPTLQIDRIELNTFLQMYPWFNPNHSKVSAV